MFYFVKKYDPDLDPFLNVKERIKFIGSFIIHSIMERVRNVCLRHLILALASFFSIAINAFRSYLQLLLLFFRHLYFLCFSFMYLDNYLIVGKKLTDS